MNQKKSPYYPGGFFCKGNFIQLEASLENNFGHFTLGIDPAGRF